MQTGKPLSTATTKRERGFTLVELVVALLVLAVGLLGLASLKAMALRQLQQHSLQATSTDQARYIMERLRADSHWRPEPKQAEVRLDKEGRVEIHMPTQADSDYRLRGQL